MKAFEGDRVAMASLTMKLRSIGLSDARLLGAFETVPRRLFAPARFHEDAYLDRAVPIECGQTLSAPSTVALGLQALGAGAGQAVLEIGCGSGYQAAILARIGARVTTLDRYRTLVDLASDRFATLKLTVEALAADGFEGFARRAPFDRIIVDGAVTRVPPALMDQLADKGVLVAPVGDGQTQTLVRITRDGRLFNRTEMGTVRFVPLVEGLASRL
ncbi:MAG TPA: protein-L-isoaspartate(D-aspartate) O-methyltransferase [Methylomirabilota bacterium]|nr:protein-L-isoaspartate(D-aspartate) O-methyltransferase [Methylomirabilota bacterium]